MDDCCNNCEAEYNFVVGQDLLYIFLDSQCHNVFTTCPNCGATTTLFHDNWAVMSVIMERELEIVFLAETPEEIHRLYGQAQTQRSVMERVNQELEDMYGRTQKALEGGQ
jgi:Ribonuclease G/E